MNYNNKTAVITGGANGIGKQLVIHFASQNCKVAFIDWDKAAGEKLLTQLEIIKHNIMFFCGDIAEEHILKEFSAKIAEKFRNVDFLIHNACLSKQGILSDCSYDDFNNVLKIGVIAPYYLTKLLLPYFNKGASVVNIGSTRAFQSQADTESYSAAKGGILSLTHALSASLSGKVRVNCISPGWIETDETAVHSASDIQQHTSGRIGKPQDIVQAVDFLLQNDFVNAQNIIVDGGMSRKMIYHNDCGWKFENSYYDSMF